MKICALRNQTARDKLQLRKRSNKRRKNDIGRRRELETRNQLRKNASRFEISACREQRYRRFAHGFLTLSRGGIKGSEKSAIPLRNYPARTVIMRIVKRTPSFLRFRIVIRLSRRDYSYKLLYEHSNRRILRPRAGLLPRDCIDRKIESYGAIERKNSSRAWLISIQQHYIALQYFRNNCN